MVLLWAVQVSVPGAMPPFGRMGVPEPPPPQLANAEQAPMQMAFETAMAAANQAATAKTPVEWATVATTWAEAIQVLQTIPPDNPTWLFAQRKAREYLANQAIALERTHQTGAPVVFPSLGNPVLDEQLGLYLSYVATLGTPDILIMGSSRALQGVNPQFLQQRLSRKGLPTPRVYNFSVNGATAQVISFLLQRVFTPEQLPRLIIWAEGSRALNSGRFDRTFARILDSPGYAALQAGDRPTLDGFTADKATPRSTSPIPITSLDSHGFMAVADVFDPARYYQQFPRVAGQYDDTYQNFDLAGLQTLSFRAIVEFTKRRKIPLVFVNLPLSADYLDSTRFFYEQQFQAFLQAEAQRGQFLVVDLLQQWETQDQYFADPSHLNQLGAIQIATQLADNPTIPWAVWLSDSDENAAASPETMDDEAGLGTDSPAPGE